jgi:hypothetical protein
MFQFGTDENSDMIMGFTPLGMSRLQYYNKLVLPSVNPDDTVSEDNGMLESTPVTRIAPNAFKDL